MDKPLITTQAHLDNKLLLPKKSTTAKLLVSWSIAWLLSAWDVDAFRYPISRQVDIKPVFSQKYNDISEFELSKILWWWKKAQYQENDYLNDLKSYHDLKSWQQDLVKKYIWIWKTKEMQEAKLSDLWTQLIAYFKQLNDTEMLIWDTRDIWYFKYEEIRNKSLSIIGSNIYWILWNDWINYQVVGREIEESLYRYMEAEDISKKRWWFREWRWVAFREKNEEKSRILDLIRRIEREF